MLNCLTIEILKETSRKEEKGMCFSDIPFSAGRSRISPTDRMCLLSWQHPPLLHTRKISSHCVEERNSGSQANPRVHREREKGWIMPGGCHICIDSIGQLQKLVLKCKSRIQPKCQLQAQVDYSISGIKDR